jgi:uncharacterized protein (DUF1800 family)
MALMNLLTPVTQDPTFRWDDKTARHLLNRAGFGVPPSAVKRLSAMPPAEAVSAFVDFEKLPDVCAAAPELPERDDYRNYKKQIEALGEKKAREVRNEFRRKEKEAMVDLQAWWIERMSKSQRPLQEKMALFWHGHFATSAEKVQAPRDNLEINEIFRRMGTGNFRELVRQVGKSNAMMRYLDQQRSNKKKPNENWSRELMELFTLGIGNYTEQDIKEAARAFTGWYVANGQFGFARRQHDDGQKTVFGKTGNFDGDDIVNLVTTRPECAKFICTKLWRSFAYDNPEPEVIEGLAKTLQDNDMNIRPVLRQMFLSRAFYQEKAYFSQVKSPAQLVVSLMVQLDTDEADPVDRVAAFAMRAMGQSLFYPPNVKGWDGGRAWINTNTLLVRYNFSSFLVSGVVPDLKGMPGGNQARREFMMAALGKPLAGSGAKMGGDSMDGMAGGGEMSGGMGGQAAKDDDHAAPAGQDAMAKDIPSRTFYEKLRERRAAKGKGGARPEKMTPEKRETLRMQIAADAAPFEARKFFAQYKGKNADQIIDEMAHYFLGFDLDDSQRAKLKQVLAQGTAPGAPVPVERMAEDDLRATVQLLLSTVEYQVC